MKSSITAIELLCVVKEIQGLLDGKIDKIYLKEDKDLFLSLHIPNIGKKMLRVKPPTFLYLTEFKGEMPTQPHGYCMFLRKHLDNARIREIRLIDFERIVEIVLETKSVKYRLLFEFFSKGNIILCDENYKIISPLETQLWKDRTIKKDEPYIYPKRDFDIFKLNETKLKEIIENSKQDNIVKILATDIGFGGVYAEELCLRSKINKNKKSLDEKELKELLKQIKQLLKLEIEAYLIKGEDIVPFNLLFYKDKEKQQFPTYSEALDSALTTMTTKAQLQQESKQNKQIEKLKNIIEQQEKQVANMEKEAELSQKKGELIYSNYQIINEILTQLKDIRKKHTWNEIKEKLKGHKIIKSINEKNSEIIVEI